MQRDPFPLEQGETILRDGAVSYQVFRYGGHMYLTTHRLSWKANILERRIEDLGGNNLDLPLIAVTGCWREGGMMVVEAPTGKFLFIFGGCWQFWRTQRVVDEWVAAVQQASADAWEREKAKA